MDHTFDKALIARYGAAAPRYTSYPPATEFHDRFRAKEFATALKQRDASQPLSLYVHLPFCESICYYCACNKIITKHHNVAAAYLDRVGRELGLLSALTGRDTPLEQLHWGGGTPTFLTQDEMVALMRTIGAHFKLVDDETAEYSVEIDPRHAEDATLRTLRAIGFNRLSMGIQDFDPEVQKAINRTQSYALVDEVFRSARDLGFRSINADLIYGLPYQTKSSFGQTLEQLLSLDPDRISLFHYAHLPQRFKHQRRITTSALPEGIIQQDMLLDAVTTLTQAGYVYIGMDHFARPTDELAQAQRDHVLSRNFQGYSTRGHLDVLGIGVSAVSRIGLSYSQNAWDLTEYEKYIDEGVLPVRRGYELNQDDEVRRDIINSLLCHMECDIPSIEARYDLDFASYFAPEMEALTRFAQDGLVEVGSRIVVTMRGQMLVRAVCAVFDHYLNESGRERFSRVV